MSVLPRLDGPTINRYPTCRPRPPLASSSLLLCSPWSAPAPIRPSLVTRSSLGITPSPSPPRLSTPRPPR
ncbi:hypothetical protein HYQ46_006717 [Verticillium longisporum]|nr:hypothetical protein HYQ46_006717 [Verticillium longisporum]